MIRFLEKYGEKVLILEKIQKSEVITKALYCLKLLKEAKIKINVDNMEEIQ